MNHLTKSEQSAYAIGALMLVKEFVDFRGRAFSLTEAQAASAPGLKPWDGTIRIMLAGSLAR